MIGTIRKFFAFAGQRGKLMQKGIALALINSIFQALQILAWRWSCKGSWRER